MGKRAALVRSCEEEQKCFNVFNSINLLSYHLYIKILWYSITNYISNPCTLNNNYFRDSFYFIAFQNIAFNFYLNFIGLKNTFTEYCYELKTVIFGNIIANLLSEFFLSTAQYFIAKFSLSFSVKIYDFN